MNRIQEKLVRKLFNAVKEKYPNIEFLSVENSPEDPEDLIINALSNYDENTEFEMKEYSASISADILDEYDYLIGIIPTTKQYAEYYRIQHRPFNISEAA